jgi:hypothetical protein
MKRKHDPGFRLRLPASDRPLSEKPVAADLVCAVLHRFHARSSVRRRPPGRKRDTANAATAVFF